MFRALRVDRTEDGFQRAVVDLTDDDLPEGAVLVAVEYSTVNYTAGRAPIRGNRQTDLTDEQQRANMAWQQLRLMNT